MQNSMPRTDLALEAHRLASARVTELKGVKAVESSRRGFNVTHVSVLDKEGSDLLCKPIGERKERKNRGKTK